MIDSVLRKSLSKDVQKLVNGDMSNDDFDDAYYERYDSSDDRAVREISGFCYCLYSSDLLVPLKLRGHHSLDEETQYACNRAVLFLQSGLEYEWPPFPDDAWLRMLSGIAFLGIPVGISFFTVGALVALAGELQFGLPLLISGMFVFAGSTIYLRQWQKFLEPDWESFRESGDYDVWPFRGVVDFDDVQPSCGDLVT